MRIAAMLLGLATCGAHGQPQDALITELDAVQRRASDRSISLREREQAGDKAMELRTRAIAAANADDPRLPGYLMDNAAGELGRLGRDGSDSAVLFGLPLPAQAEAVQQGAARAVELLDRAAALLEERWKAVEASPPDDPIRIQVEQDRTVRIPFFASRARVLLAAGLAPGAERTRLAKAAFDAVGKLSLSSPGPESIRRITVGAALLLRSSPLDDADLQTAIDEFGWVLTGAAGNPQPGASAVTRAEAWFGIIAGASGLGRLDALSDEFTKAQQREPFLGPDGKADALLVVLATDALTRAWVDRAAAIRDRSLLDRAVSAQQSLLRRTDLPLRPDSLRPLVYQKLHLATRRIPGMDLPPAMSLATAIEAARDSGRRDEALKALRAVADAPDSGDFAADALWELAVLRAPGTATDRLIAIKDLTQLARDFPTLPRATEAISAALSYAQNLAADAANTGAREQYIQTLALAHEKFPELSSIDTWRYEYARLLADRPAAPIADIRTALQAVRLVRPSASIAADAARLHERVQAQVIDEAWQRIAAARREATPDRVIALSREELLPEARRAVDWATSAGSPVLDRFRADLADALTEIGDAGGQKLYEDLIARKVEVPGSGPRLRLGQARSLIIAGQTGAAFAILRDLATALDAPSPSDPARPRSETFWHAWTLMLEELVARNADGARTSTIVANIRRLESIDPGYGGEPWRSRISTVLSRARR